MDDRNMLSAKKVKLHGMTSTSWTTKDKITQYKGLINLYSRDRKIIEVDTSVANKKQHRESKNLQKMIILKRAELDNAIRGDKQQLRNTLSDHKEMLLAYQNSPPKKVIECVEHINFKKRKELDRLLYTMKIRSQVLTDLRLEKSILEDRINEIVSKMPVEQKAQIIAGKVQDAILKKEAAIAIKHTYGKMIDIMKKDALYFDAILQAIKNDGLSQSKCMINATKLGQLATEYLDDRRQEYKELEKVVIRDMQTRKTDLGVVQEQVDNACDHIKQLIRRDSDINTCVIKIDDTFSYTELQSDLKKIEATLVFLKDTTLVPDFETIFPCLQEQKRQNERLTDMAQKSENYRNIMLNKVENAILMKDNLKNTMISTTLQYKDTKEDLLDLIKEENKKREKSEFIIKKRLKITAKVRVSLRQIQQLCKPIKIGDQHRKQEKEINKFASLHDEPNPPYKEEISGTKIVSELVPKLEYLQNNITSEKLDISNVDETYKLYEYMMKERAFNKPSGKLMSEESLLEGLTLEVSHILTREDIKRISAQIVEQNTKSDELK